MPALRPYRDLLDGTVGFGDGEPCWYVDVFAPRAAAAVALKAAAYQRPHLARGWRWALSHPDSEACAAERRCTFAEWVTEHEPAHVRGLGEWDRKGTGFDG